MSVPAAFLDSDDLQALAAEQRREIMAAKALDADQDFAFDLQLQEAINASLSLQNLSPTSTSAFVEPKLPERVQGPTHIDLLSEEVRKLEQELQDRAISETVFKKLKDDIHLRCHDYRVALEVSRMPDEEWQDWGDNFERPFGVGTSKGVSEETFRVYFKGLVEKQSPNGVPLGGIGVAICDSRDELLFELRKPMTGCGMNRTMAELKAVIEALTAALELELKSVILFCDSYTVFKYVTLKWSAKQRKVFDLVSQVSHLQDDFTSYQPILVSRSDIKFAFKLAREAIDSQVTGAAESIGSAETCAICLEEKRIDQIFSVENCLHRYCFSCMKQHVEVKLLHGSLPTCPHEGCKSQLRVDSCCKFLTPKLMDIMSQRVKESLIPVNEKVYCPYPKCSALMSKREVLGFSKTAILGAEASGARNCMQCNLCFCINCKVPWHANMTCLQYRRINPNALPEDAKLKNLATQNMWRQCVKCHHMIEHATGCYHITCRCGYEFCYTCGAEWRRKKPTCSCPIWDEDNILDEALNEEDEEEEEEEEDDSDEEYLFP